MAPSFNNGKGWSFSNIYSLKELRDIYIVSKNVESKNLKNITLQVVGKIIAESTKDWNERKVLEYLNALVNFRLLDSNYEIRKFCFEGSELNSPLTEKDKNELKGIFFDYFRFREISSWFFFPKDHKDFWLITIDNLIENSIPIYFIANNNRFADTFIYDLQSSQEKYIIEDNMSHLMRFWDVFLKWGISLKIIDKINLSKLEIKTTENKDISMVYFIKPFDQFNLVQFIEHNYSSFEYEIFIPQLIFSIASKFRYSVESIKLFIEEQLISNSKITFERTSQIFIIKGKKNSKKIIDATYLYPMIDNSYVSHLIIRK